jgi:hypothetical protein
VPPFTVWSHQFWVKRGPFGHSAVHPPHRRFSLTPRPSLFFFLVLISLTSQASNILHLPPSSLLTRLLPSPGARFNASPTPSSRVTRGRGAFFLLQASFSTLLPPRPSICCTIFSRSPSPSILFSSDKSTPTPLHGSPTTRPTWPASELADMFTYERSRGLRRQSVSLG